MRESPGRLIFSYKKDRCSYTMTYTQFIAGNYALKYIADPVARGRRYFEQLEGKLIMRKINLREVPLDAYDLPQRPEYTPHIHIFQLKKLGGDPSKLDGDPSFKFVQFSQLYFVHNDFLTRLEQDLRKIMTEVPTPDMDKVPEEFLHYYNTDFALVTCDYEKITVSQRVSSAGDTDVLQPLASGMRFRGVDFKAGATFRMIEPTLLEKKLQEIEEKAAYHLSIVNVKDVSGPQELLYDEHKEAWNHWVMKKK